MTFRLSLMAAATLAAAIVGCDDATDEKTASGIDSSSAAMASTATPDAAAQGGASTAVTMDSIPVRTPDGKPARFARRSGYVRYRYSGDVAGFREAYFDDWGMLERRYDSSGPIQGKAGAPDYRMLISRPESFVQIDMLVKTGQRMQNISDEEYLASDSGATHSLGEMIFRRSPGIRLVDTTIMGLRAAVLQLDQGGSATRVYVWQGLVLREEFASADGMRFVVEADSIAFDIEIPPSKFDVPSGITITDAPAPGSQGPAGGGAPPGAMPPGAMPPGAVPPGAMPPGAMPPGAQPMPGRR